MKKGELISKIFGIALVFVMLASTLGGLVWARESDVVGAGYVDVSVEQARGMIDSDPDVIVLDVRTENEYEAGHIAGTELVPLSELEQRTGELDKDDALLVYCKSGTKSVEASNILIQHEFESVYNMEGGINAWVNAGYPVVSSSNDLLSSEIDAILDADKSAFLFFYADWCHFCHEQMPIIEELELEYAEEIGVIHVNSEDNPQAITGFGVAAFPTMFLISDRSADGEYRYQEFAGFTDKETLNQSFDRAITNGNISEGSDVHSDTIGEEATAITATDISQDLCIQALAAEACPDHCECLTDEEAEERELTLCNNELTECWYWSPALGDEVMGHCYQTEEEPVVCRNEDINLRQVHLESGEIRFIADISCPVARVEMIIGGIKVKECAGGYCEYTGGPYGVEDAPDFSAILYDNFDNPINTFAYVPYEVTVSLPDVIVEPPPELEDLCPYCPEPEPGWGNLTGCLCRGSVYNKWRAYDRTSWVQPSLCSYKSHFLWGVEVGGVKQFPIAGPFFDYCINEDDIVVHKCDGHYIFEYTGTCPYGCEDGQCICSDTDGGRDYHEYGGVRNGTSVVSGATDYCLDDKILMEYYTITDLEDNYCRIRAEEYECPGACRDGACGGDCYDGIQNQDEQGVDCGGSSCPASCLDCFADAAFGSAEDADLLCLGSTAVLNASYQALFEYANCLGNATCRATLHAHAYNLDMNFSTVTPLDLSQSTDYIMEAVAYYVDQHTTYMCDDDCDICYSGGEINAENMIVLSGGRSGYLTCNVSSPEYVLVDTCPTDYCGDCEDHAILREALMRQLGVSWRCAFCADHYDHYRGGGHVFNLVYYRNRWRIMDYGLLGCRFSASSFWDQHIPNHVWNDRLGEYFCPRSRRNLGVCNHKDPYGWTQNYNGGEVCVSGGVDTYYVEFCP